MYHGLAIFLKILIPATTTRPIPTTVNATGRIALIVATMSFETEVIAVTVAALAVPDALSARAEILDATTAVTVATTATIFALALPKNFTQDTPFQIIYYIELDRLISAKTTPKPREIRLAIPTKPNP